MDENGRIAMLARTMHECETMNKPTLQRRDGKEGEYISVSDLTHLC
jgi:hypothetical protein